MTTIDIEQESTLIEKDFFQSVMNDTVEDANIVESAFRYGPLPTLIINPFANQVVEANEAACKLLGQGLPDLFNMQAHELFTETAGQLISFTEQVLVQQKAWTDELMIRTAHDQSLRIETVASILELDETLYLECIFQPFTDAENHRKHIEAQWHYKSGIQHWKRISKVFQDFEKENQLILDAAGEGIYGVDAEGLTTFVNPAAERMLGWSAEELHGKNIHYVIHATHEDGSHFHLHDCPIYQAFKEGVVNKSEHDVFWHKDGYPIQVAYTSNPIKDGEQVIGSVVIFRDISEKLQSEKKLRDALTEVESLREKLELEKAYLQEEISSEFNHHQIVGNSPAIHSILEKIQLVAATNSTVLINGESGTGKELIARAIHDTSDRRSRPLIRVNCAAIPSELFESEFFGHSRGAFTGATEKRIGRFEVADGGTLFLDEVGEIPLSLQGKLLRVLQEQQFERVGESKTRTVDVRIIAATNQDLRALVEDGSFREDLYFRLNVFPIESVPLRQRKDDIPMLAQHFLNRAIDRTNKRDVGIPLSQLDKLQQYSWPGNIRELENIIERQVILAKGNSIRFDFLQADDVFEPVVHTGDGSVTSLVKTDEQLRELEKENLKQALRETKGKVSGKDGAANLLGLPNTTVASKIKKYRIKIEAFKS